jgi:arsenate reductase
MSNTIYHYEHCGKSIGALALLKQHGVEAEVIDYLVTPPTMADLERLSKLLGLGALAMMRTTDKHFAELGLSTTDQRSDQEWFSLILKHPILLQRPIVVIGGRAIIARPADLVLQLLK